MNSSLKKKFLINCLLVICLSILLVEITNYFLIIRSNHIVLPIVCIILFSGALIWYLVNNFFKNLQTIIKTIAQEFSKHHRPLDDKDLDHIPLEIRPIIYEINKLLQLLEQSTEREQRFAIDAAHELRTPLAALKAQAQVALQETNPEERKLVLKNVIAGVDRSSHTIHQLLTLNRLAPGSSHFEKFTLIHLDKIVVDVILQLASFAVEKDINLELTPESNRQNFLVRGNILALSVLVRNLIDNAIRYTPSGGYVHVHLEETLNNIILHVIDNGPGIPQALHTRVFERFFRILGSASSGSGLGFIIIQQIANLHDAKILLGTPLNGRGLEAQIIFDKAVVDENEIENESGNQ